MLPPSGISPDSHDVPFSPAINLLVATINRRRELERLLRSFTSQSYRKFSVFIADQNPLGYLDDILAAFPSISLQHVRVAPYGVSYARNALIPLAKGEIIAFPDDDCWYQPDTLANVAYAFAQNPAMGGLLGVWAPDAPSFTATRFVVSKVAHYAECFSRAETYVQFYRKEVIQRVGGFDEHLGPGTGLPYGCGEDTDYLLRAQKVNCEIYRTNSVCILHPEPDRIHLRHEKIEAYALGRMYLLKKHALPTFFVVLNILFPLIILPAELIRRRAGIVSYRIAMFYARLRAWHTCRKIATPDSTC